MWTANIGNPQKDSAGIAIAVTFTSDQGTSETTVFHFQTESPTDVQNIIQAHIDKLTAQDALLGGISAGAFTPPEPPPPPPPPAPPDQDALNRQAYEEALLTLEQVNQAVSAGAILADDPLVTSAQDNVKAAWGLISQGIADKISTAQVSISTQVGVKTTGQVIK